MAELVRFDQMPVRAAIDPVDGTVVITFYRTGDDAEEMLDAYSLFIDNHKVLTHEPRRFILERADDGAEITCTIDYKLPDNLSIEIGLVSLEQRYPKLVRTVISTVASDPQTFPVNNLLFALAAAKINYRMISNDLSDKDRAHVSGMLLGIGAGSITVAVMGKG